MSSAKGSEAAALPVFQSRDPRTAAFWDERFEQGFTPWDEGGSPAQLLAWLTDHPSPAGRRVFIPGAGLGHEVQAFHAAGDQVLALDISPVAVAKARATLGVLGNRVQLGDAFAQDPDAPFDLMYERAFLCALPADAQQHWAAMAQRAVKPGGCLIGFFYLSPAPSTKGPPFATTMPALRALLAPAFALEQDQPCADGLPAFRAGTVHWQVWRRQAPERRLVENAAQRL